MFDKVFTQSNRTADRLLTVSFASFVVVVLMTSLPARADVTWTLPAGQSGDWSVASNWGGTLPTSSDTATIVNGGTATITLLGEVCGTLSLGGSTGSGTVQMTNGGLSTGAQYVGSSGLGTFTQSGGINNINIYDYTGLYLANNAGSSGTYNLSGNGQLSAPSEYVGYSGTGTFTQSGGTNNINGYYNNSLYLGNKAASSGTYNLTGSGQLSAGTACVGYSGTGTFTQSGGTHSIANALYLGYNAGSSGTYNLSGSGQLSAGGEYFGYSPGATALFQQTGGMNTASGLSIGSGGTYLLAGGALQVNGSLVNQGIFAGSGTPAVLSVNCLWDLSNGTWQNLGALSVSMGTNSLLIVPAGFNPSTGFAQYSSLGLTHTLGTTLTVPAGQGFGGSGSISDPVNCQERLSPLLAAPSTSAEG
ncbi:MAG: hypothetical protein ACLP9L_27775 [Thermoguttaceae bacterium]